MERIGEEGLLLSEYPPNTMPQRYCFPKRNRIIAALSTELYVIGCGNKSGTSSTVEYSRKYGRNVYLMETTPISVD